MQEKTLKKLFLSTLALVLSSCSTVIPKTEVCSVSGVMAAGADCADTQGGATRSMTLNEWIDFLEPQQERSDPANPKKNLPARAGAMCQSSQDWNKQKTALEQICREFGTHCTYEIQQAISRIPTAPLPPR